MMMVMMIIKRCPQCNAQIDVGLLNSYNQEILGYNKKVQKLIKKRERYMFVKAKDITEGKIQVDNNKDLLQDPYVFIEDDTDPIKLDKAVNILAKRIIAMTTVSPVVITGDTNKGEDPLIIPRTRGDRFQSKISLWTDYSVKK
jgi:hypothetical protein